MNQDDSWALDDTQKNERAELIKEQLKAYPWDAIKKDPNIIDNVFARNPVEIDPASMLMSEKTLTLSLIFQNYQIIPPDSQTKILETFGDSDLKDIAQLKLNLDKVCSGLILKEDANLGKLQKDAVALINGIYNIKKIAFLGIAKDLYNDIQIVKRNSKEKIDSLLSQLQTLDTSLRSSLDKQQELGTDQINKAGEILKIAGRTPFEIEQLKSGDNIFILLDVFQKIKDAMTVVQQAHQDNLVNELDNVEAIAEILPRTPLHQD